MNIPQVSEQVPVLEMANAVIKTSIDATKVVGWYAHPESVRGPFCRWLTVSEVPPDHKKDVGSRAADAMYASTCMNYAPRLAEEVIRLTKLLKETT